MKKVTKIALLFVVALVCLAAATTVNAATNDELVEYIGAKFSNSSMVVPVQKYLQANPVSEPNANKIIANLTQIANLVGNQTNPANLSQSVKNQVISLAQASAQIAGGNLTIKNGVATLTGKNDEPIANFDPNEDDIPKVDPTVPAPAPTTVKDPTDVEEPADAKDPAEAEDPADAKDPAEVEDPTDAKEPVEEDKKEEEDKGEAAPTGVVYTNIIIALAVVGLAGLGIAYLVKKD